MVIVILAINQEMDFGIIPLVGAGVEGEVQETADAIGLLAEVVAVRFTSGIVRALDIRPMDDILLLLQLAQMLPGEAHRLRAREALGVAS